MSGQAVMRAMIQLGLTDEQKIVLLDAIALDAGPSQSPGAIRQKRYREKRKGNATSDVTRDVTDVTQPPLDENNSNPPVCVNISPRARGYHRLPEGWRPTRPLPLKTQAKADQWPPGAIEDELAGLHRWAVNAKNENGKGKKLDWDAAWANWIERRHDERYRRTDSMGGNNRNGGSASGMGRTIDAAQRFVARGGPN